jgi:hypothetical protein
MKEVGRWKAGRDETGLSKLLEKIKNNLTVLHC